MLGVIAYFYFTKFFLPVKLKNILEIKAFELLNRKISIEDIKYEPHRGLILRNIIIYEKGHPEKHFIRIDKVFGNILFTSFFKRKQIIIPSLHILKPVAYITFDANRLWNFSDLLPSSSNDDKNNKYSFYIRNIKLNNGNTFTLIANNCTSKNKYIQSATLNGEILDRTWFTHDDLMKGSTLVIEMGAYPNKNWCTEARRAPPSGMEY